MQLWHIGTVGGKTEILGVKPIKLPFFPSHFYLDWPRIGCRKRQPIMPPVYGMVGYALCSTYANI
jgi:hypothetical protein